jgi:hypothetical protein
MIDTEPLFGPGDAAGAQLHRFRVFPRTGAERWMLAATQRRPWHLKTWPRASLRARAIYRTAWTLGALGLHLPHRLEQVAVAPGSAYAQLQAGFDRLGIFLGTPGPNRKIVVYAGRPDRAVFVKIPLGANSAALVAREAAALAELAGDPDLAPLVPAAGTIAGHLAIEDIETAGVRHAALNLPELRRIHDLLERRSAGTRPLSALRADWQEGLTAPRATHDAGRMAALGRTRAAANGWLDRLPPDLAVPCYMAHGDFTRWNVLRAADGRARIIDWELFGPKPRWFDPIHYVVSHLLLVERSPAATVLDRLDRLGGTEPGALWWRHVGLYFAYQSLYYTGVYGRQPDLHPQALWQLAAWADCLDLLRQRPST